MKSSAPHHHHHSFLPLFSQMNLLWRGFVLLRNLWSSSFDLFSSSQHILFFQLKLFCICHRYFWAMTWRGWTFNDCYGGKNIIADPYNLEQIILKWEVPFIIDIICPPQGPAISHSHFMHLWKEIYIWSLRSCTSSARAVAPLYQEKQIIVTKEKRMSRSWDLWLLMMLMHVGYLHCKVWMHHASKSLRDFYLSCS